MGQASSQPRGPGLYFANQQRFRIKSLKVVPNLGDETAVSSHSETVYDGGPLLEIAVDQQSLQVNAKYAQDKPLEFTQELDPAGQQLLLRVPYCSSLTFSFQLQLLLTPNSDISSLTFVTAESRKTLDNFVDVKLLQNPNLQNEDNVVLLGDFATKDDAPKVTSYTFNWTWEPPFTTDKSSGGWPLHFTFCEYVKSSHKLAPLAGGGLWISERPEDSLSWQTAALLSDKLGDLPPRNDYKLRELSVEALPEPYCSAMLSPTSDETAAAALAPTTTASQPQAVAPPSAPSEAGLGSGGNSRSGSGTRLESRGQQDVAVIPATRPDLSFASQPEDGPLFRSSIASMEKRSPMLKSTVKMLLKRALFMHERLKDAAEAERWLEAGITNAAKTDLPSFAVLTPFYGQPRRGFDALRSYTSTLANDLQQHVISPLRDFYENEMKMLDMRKRDFDDESSQYYSWMSRYLSTKKERKDKTVDADAKYSEKRRTFELSRFDYYTFLLDVHGGKKTQFLALQLGLFIDRLSVHSVNLGEDFAQNTSKAISEALKDIRDAGEDWSQQRMEREMNRRALERSISELDTLKTLPRIVTNSFSASNAGGSPSTAALTPAAPLTSHGHGHGPNNMDRGPASAAIDKDPGCISPLDAADEFIFSDHHESGRKEGLLWALSRPGGVQEMQKQGLKWHKYWVVQDCGRLCEYTNWKQNASLHNEPIDLKLAHVRESASADRRFCFEVVTPQYKRVYQATSDDDMRSWIKSITKGISDSLRQVLPSSVASASLSSGGPGGHNGIGSSSNSSGTGAAGNGGVGSGIGGGSGDGFYQASIQQLISPKQRDTMEKLESLGRKLSLKADKVRVSSQAAAQKSFAPSIQRHHSHSMRSTSEARAADINRATASSSAAARSGQHASDYLPRSASVEEPLSNLVLLNIDLGDQNAKEAIEAISRHQGNLQCADCGCTVVPEWVSINLISVLCIACSGVHRSLGTHISKIRSLHLDYKSFTPELLVLFKTLSNTEINQVWEEKLDPINKQLHLPNESARAKFITQKYVEKKYIGEMDKPNFALRKALEQLNIFEVYKALASRANSNTTSDDDEPLLINALRLADERGESYAVAELLLLNGATIPANTPETLSETANHFLQNRNK